MRKGVLLVNLGTPDSPDVKDVRKYLAEFLMDGRVIDIHPVLRFLLVRGIIAPFRGPKSAKLYKKIWDRSHGSPLLYFSEVQQRLLKAELGDGYHVELAMRYQAPSISSALNKLRDAGVTSIKVIPLFPQYASATTGSVIAKVMETVGEWHTIPEISFVNSFYDNELVIQAFADRARAYHPASYDHILFSFHGLPERHLQKCDNSGTHCLRKPGCCSTISRVNQNCYGAQTYRTATLIARELDIPKSKYTVCYQSRLGNDPWMQPYTSQVIHDLAKAGKKRVLVICPAFVADCLETIYEIGDEYKEEFIGRRWRASSAC